MKPAEQEGTACTSFVAPAPQQPAAAQKSGAENISASARRAPSNMDMCMSQPSSSGALGSLSTAECAPVPVISSNPEVAAQRQTEPMTMDKAPPFSECSARSRRDAGHGPTYSQLHAGAKRGRTLAFLGDAVSARTEPSQSTQLRQLTSLPAHFGRDAQDPRRCLPASSTAQGARQAGSAPTPPRSISVGCVDADMQAHLGGLAQSAGAAMPSRGQVTRPVPLAASSAPSSSTSTVIGGLSPGSGQLAALLSASSPAMLDRLLAAAWAGPSSGPPQSSSHGAATATSPNVSVAVGSQQQKDTQQKAPLEAQAQDEAPRADRPHPFRRWQAASSAAPTGLHSGNSAAASGPFGGSTVTSGPVGGNAAATSGSRRHSAPATRRTAFFDGGSASCRSSLAAAASAEIEAAMDRACGGSEPVDETVAAGRRNGADGAGGNKGGASAGAKPCGSVAHTTCDCARTRGGVDAVARGVMECAARPAGAASRPRDMQCAGGSAVVGDAQTADKAPKQVGMSTAARPTAAAAAAAGGPAVATGPSVAASPAQQPLPQQAAEPVSAQLAALPPEMAARLKKPVRIIQPISKAWVEETLQCASGTAGAATTSVSNAAGRSATTPASVSPAASAGIAKAPHYQAGSRQQGLSPAAETASLPGGQAENWPRGDGGGGGGTGPTAAGATAGAAAVAAAGPDAAAALPRSGGAAAGAAQGARICPAAGESLAARPGAPALDLPCELTLRDTPTCAIALAAPAVTTGSSPPTLPAAARLPAGGPPPPSAAPAVTVADPSPLAAALAARISLPVADAASPFVMSSLGALPLRQAIAGPAGSGGVIVLPRSNGSNTTTIASATPTTASPFSSGAWLPMSSSGTTRPGASSDTARAALLTASAPVPPHNAAGGVAAHGARSPPDVLPCSRGAVPAAAGLATVLPLQARQLQAQQPASTARSTSASCLGKVQGELTLLYQWYVANKAVYLDQAQRQLQRIEALTATDDRGGTSAADAATAACARAESAEAMRAFETAMKIMSVCGRVEQQWLAVQPAAAAATAPAADLWQPLSAAAPPPPPVRIATAPGPTGRAAEALAQAPGSAATQIPANVPAPSSGWAHGASAALAVAAALVGSVARGQSSAQGPPDEVSPTSAVGVGVAPRPLRATGPLPSTEIPLSSAVHGVQAAPRPVAVSPAALAPAVPLPPPLLATSAALPRAAAPVSPLTAA